MNELFQEPVEYAEMNEYPDKCEELFVSGSGSWDTGSECSEPGAEDFSDGLQTAVGSEKAIAWNSVKTLMLKMGYLVTAGATVFSLSLTTLPEDRPAEETEPPVYTETLPEPSAVPIHTSIK